MYKKLHSDSPEIRLKPVHDYSLIWLKDADLHLIVMERKRAKLSNAQESKNNPLESGFMTAVRGRP